MEKLSSAQIYNYHNNVIEKVVCMKIESHNVQCYFSFPTTKKKKLMPSSFPSSKLNHTRPALLHFGEHSF